MLEFSRIILLQNSRMQMPEFAGEHGAAELVGEAVVECEQCLNSVFASHRPPAGPLDNFLTAQPPHAAYLVQTEEHRPSVQVVLFVVGNR